MVAVSSEYGDPFEEHISIQERLGSTWFGKFTCRNRGGGKEPDQLDPEGERFSGPGDFDCAQIFIEDARLGNRKLVMVDPDRDDSIVCGMADIVGASYWDFRDIKKQFRLPDGVDPNLVPGYYFQGNNRGNGLAYHCNYWFRILGLVRLAKTPEIWVEGKKGGAVRFRSSVSITYPVEILDLKVRGGNSAIQGGSTISSVFDAFCGSFQRVVVDKSARKDVLSFIGNNPSNAGELWQRLAEFLMEFERGDKSSTHVRAIRGREGYFRYESNDYRIIFRKVREKGVDRIHLVKYTSKKDVDYEG
jgi:mRNA-degrading endonuclease RelE of RelBE toxin-antitoxin system